MSNITDVKKEASPKSVFEQLEVYLIILYRRKWFIFIPAFFITLIGAFMALTLPPSFISTTLILIEPQQVPSTIVTPADSTPIQARLKTLRAQILSRTNLEKIVKEFQPFKEKSNNESSTPTDKIRRKIKEIVSKLLKKVHLQDFIKLDSSGMIIEEKVKKLRKNIRIKIVSAGRQSSATFEISTIGGDPYTTMRVTNTIASLYIEENLKMREQFAVGTSNFLTNELNRAKGDLEEQEATVKTFRMKHMGALPEQLDTNLRTLDRLQSVSDNLYSSLIIAEGERARAKENLKRQEALLKRDRENMMTTDLKGHQVVRPNTLKTEFLRLKSELSSALVKFSENYPDVIMLRSRLRNLEVQLKASKELHNNEDGSVEKGAKTVDNASLPVLDSIEISDSKNQISEINHRIKLLKLQISKTTKQIKIFGKRVEETPGNEQEMTELLRNINMSNRNYESLLEKKLNARLSENMEKRQKGEKFRVIDPASFPLTPFKPNRLLILLGSIAFGIAAGGGLVYLLEFINPPFRSAGEYANAMELPVLAIIPLFQSLGRKKRKNSRNQDNVGIWYDLDPMILEQYYILYTRYEQIMTEQKGAKIVAITSAVKGEGKSINSIIFGYVLAKQFDKKVIIVECDLKRPSLLSYFPDIHTSVGLIDVLKGNGALSDCTQPVGKTRLSLLPAPHAVSNSIKFLNSNAFTKLFGFLKTQYEYIILDCPPILHLADINLIHPVADDVILVTMAGNTPKDLVQKAAYSIGREKITGLVLNGVDVILRKEYYNYYK